RAVETAVRRALGTFEAGATFGRPVWFQPAPAAPLEPPPTADFDALVSPRVAVDDGLFEAIDAAPGDASDDEPAVDRRPPFANVPALTQLHRTYMMFEHDQGVVLIDQHSAHERVLYERFLRTLEGGEQPAQRLLMPLTLHLGPGEAEAFDQHREQFER